MGRITARNKLLSKSISFYVFFAEYYLRHLKLQTKDKFVFFMILLKNDIGRDRLDISKEEILCSST